MQNIEDLLNNLANLDALHDFEAIQKLRENLIANFPESDEAVEAQYRLGLDFLFRQRDIQLAMKSFEAAVNRKHAYWSPAARTSLGLCYYHQKRTQKAFFELRRVAFIAEPTIHSVTALTFLDNIYTETGDTEEASRARTERIKQLEKLVHKNTEPSKKLSARGHYLFQLAVAYRDDGRDIDAKKFLEEARDLGPETLGADLYRAVIDMLKS
jgi:tetratricopeptide (TPR) repeat protein